MKSQAILYSVLILSVPLRAQKQETLSATPRIVDFTASPIADGFQFIPLPPPLTQKAGAPEAYWTYFWEFGDGSFSFDERPLHVYPTAGNFNPILEATAHYDDGGPPKKKGKGVLANLNGHPSEAMPTVFDSTRLAIRMKPSRPARAGEEMVCILSYRNLSRIKTDGRLHVFFNERKFSAAHFALNSARLYFNEKIDDAVSQTLPTEPLPTQGWTLLNLPSHTGVSTLLSGEFPSSTILDNYLGTARGAYRNEKIWRFSDLQPGEKRNLFVALRGTDKMLKDTNAFIHVEAIFAPFDPAVAPERFELEFEIVSSHDPNAIIVSDSRVNYRSIDAKKIDYKVQFQNNGEGPASTVELKIEIPEGLDMKQMRPLDWYPKCPVCPKSPTNTSCLDTMSSKEGLVFTFRNIYLPGSRQEGVEHRDSTQGFVRYRIEAERDMPKRSFRSRAKITFDKNAPIYTNFTRTRFKTGLSPGLKVGYGLQPNWGSASTSGENDEPLVQGGYFFLGASLSPFKSWRVYPQLELLTGIKGREETASLTSSADTTFNLFHAAGVKYDLVVIDSVIEESSRGHLSIEVPVLLRKNFSRYFGAGLGGSALFQFNNGEIRVKNRHIVITELIQGLPGDLTSDTMSISTTPISTNITRFTAFGDLSFGSVRKGLNLGLRAGAILGRKKKVVPFVQLSLELKL